jgi:hypothetical protein
LGGSDGNDGLSWANRKLTLNGVEDTPVVAGDTIYVGPGVYRELLVCDVSGSSGQPITYIADVTGENTDGIGGIVRVTGFANDNDTTGTRTACIQTNSQDYRTFRGFALDGGTSRLLHCTSSDNCIFEDMFFQCEDTGHAIQAGDTSSVDNTVRRCIFILGSSTSSYQAIYAGQSSQVANSDWLIENCVFFGHGRFGGCIWINYHEGWVVKNCSFLFCYTGITAANVSADPLVVNNCFFYGIGANCFSSPATGHITEDYNAFFGNYGIYNNVTPGGNSVTRAPLFEPPTLLDGFDFLKYPFTLSEWSDLIRKAGSGEATDDLLGIARPTTSSKKSWGALQYRGKERETTTTYDSSAASIKLDDAGEVMFFVPVDGSEITISVQVYREANYAGTLPRMIIRQPGQSDRVTTDTGSVSQWNELTDTFTPDSGTEFVVVILRSLNTATSGSYDTFFDALTVT